MVSYLGPLKVGVAEAALLGFAVGVALAEWAARHMPADGTVGLKWPNDLMLNGAKAGGVLLEADAQGGWMILGLGVNLLSSPQSLTYPTASLSSCGAAAVPTPDAALADIAPACAHWAGMLAAEGFAPIRAAWTRWAHGLGVEAMIDMGNEKIAGTLSGLDGQGALVVVTETGPRTIGAGDVFFPQVERC